MQGSVLIIEDEPTLATLLSYNLKQKGYETKVINDGTEGMREALDQSYDLILLDIMLPGMNGFEVLSEIRKQGNKTPVIILTARDTEEEVVAGLTSGADDYMTKPFGVAELFARVSAVMRRTQSGAMLDDAEPDEQMIVSGELVVYPEKYEATVAGKPITLRPKEFELLHYFVQHPGIVITREQLMDVVWGFDFAGGQRTVDVHVSTLRKKIETDQKSVEIVSIRGIGYKFVQH